VGRFLEHQRVVLEVVLEVVAVFLERDEDLSEDLGGRGSPRFSASSMLPRIDSMISPYISRSFSNIVRMS